MFRVPWRRAATAAVAGIAARCRSRKVVLGGAVACVALMAFVSTMAQQSASKRSAIRFTDVTAAAGIDFTHEHGGSGGKNYIETVSPGTCWLDYDGDGWQDFYIVQSGLLPGVKRPPGSAHSRLYRNQGDGTFLDVTLKAGVPNSEGYGSGCAVSDYDNDGDTDLYVTNFAASLLYRNNGDGTFTDVAPSVGVENGLYACAAAWADYDNDGHLDLFVNNYVDFTMETEKYCGDLKKGRRSYCHPNAYGGLPSVLYHNEGNGKFKEVSKEVGIWDPNGKGLGIVWFDYDRDGDLDLYVVNDATPNLMYRNKGDGTFEDVTLFAGVCCNEDGTPESSMGVDVGDVDGDGWLDLLVTNLSSQTNQLYHNLGGIGFAVDTFQWGLGEISLVMTGWGNDLFDYDHDGDLDLIITNGHPMDDIGKVSDIITYMQRPFFFENLGQGKFEEIGERLGPYFKSTDVGRGLGTCDYDNDGDRDVLIAPNAAKAKLLRNDGGNEAGHWIGMRLHGVKANRDAVGAWVTIKAGGKEQVEEVRGSTSYMSQNDMRIHFGLGDATRIDSIEIRWPNGAKTTETVGPVEADQYLTIVEGKGIVARSAPGEPHP